MSEPKIYTPPLDVEQICEIIPTVSRSCSWTKF